MLQKEKQQQQQRLTYLADGGRLAHFCRMAASSPAPAAASGCAAMPTQQRKLGAHELFNFLSHEAGNLTLLTGLTLLTRHSIDEGLMKCALQEFQHSYPQLTSRIVPCPGPRGGCGGGSGGGGAADCCLHFAPMECPILPLDTSFQCKDMLHHKFATQDGPLWRVQLITQASMDLANLGFGPELQAILEDDECQGTRWRHLLRYTLGRVNRSDISPYDDQAEGFRSLILMSFHPSITDVLGSLHLLRHFLIILDCILEQQANPFGQASREEPPPALHSTIESLVSSKEPPYLHIWSMGKALKDYMLPYRSPLEDLLAPAAAAAPTANCQTPKTLILRGSLDEKQTAELLAIMEEDDCSLTGVLLAAALVASSRLLTQEGGRQWSYPLTFRVSHEMNLRQYCQTPAAQTLGSKALGCFSTYHEADYSVPEIHERPDFWAFAHSVTVKYSLCKGSKEPLQNLKSQAKWRGQWPAESGRFRCDMGVNVYGDIGALMRRSSDHHHHHHDAWSRPLSSSKSNIQLEDVVYYVATPTFGVPFTHTAHLLHDKLNYMLLYSTSYVPDQRYAFLIRDEMINILRMAVDKQS